MKINKPKRSKRPVLESAAWGVVRGIAVLALLAMPSYAGANKPSGATSASPDSVVWGPGHNAPVAPITTSSTNPGGNTVESKFANDLNDHVDQNGMVTVIVQYRSMPSGSTLTGLKGRGAAIQSKLHVIRAVTMHVPASMIQELAQDPNVLYITPDRPVSLTSNPVVEEFATAVQADLAA